MNYKHIYHAGNFADIIKHIVLSRIIEYFKLKDKAFRVIDTHAGPGTYDLFSEEAQRTGEFKTGINNFLSQDFNLNASTLLAPWLNIIKQLNESHSEIRFYPGSPIVSRSLFRKQDRLTAIELHPESFKNLRKSFVNDYQSKIINLNGWLALKAQLPVKEKRAIVLVDPPFEAGDEHQRLVNGLEQAYKRCATASYILWYPIKYQQTHKNFIQAISNLGIKKILNIELFIKEFDTSLKEKDKIKTAMPGCGLILVNAPYILEDELKILQPYILNGLAQAEGARLALTHLS